MFKMKIVVAVISCVLLVNIGKLNSLKVDAKVLKT